MTKFLKNADVTGYISQTSVTSSLVKTDVDGKLVAAIAGTDYNAPGVTASAGTLVREIRNTTGATLTKGTIVYISGATGNKPTVSKALATGDSTSAQTFGMCQTDIPNNSNGNVVCFGDLSGLDTSAYTEGVQLYLSSTTAGEYTSTKQLAPAHLVYIGVVTRAHPTLGQIEVRIQNGYELDEIHDVAISSLANNQGLFYESATDLWKNKTIATVLGYTPADDAAVVKLTGIQTITGVKTFTGAGNTFTQNTNFQDRIYLKSPTTTTYSSLGGDDNKILVGVIGATHQFIFTPNTNYNYTFPAASGTLALTSQLSSYLPLSGGTLTGALSGTSATFSGTLQASDNLRVYGAHQFWFGSAFRGQIVNYGAYAGTTDWSPFFTSETSLAFGVNGNATKALNIATTGAATFSSTLRAVRLDAYGSGTNDLLFLDAGVNTDFAYKIVSGADDAFVLRRQHTTQGNFDIMSWTYSGKVGVNTNSPTRTLHVYTTDNEGIFLQGTGGGVWMNIQSSAGNLWSIGAQNDGMGVYNRTSSLYAFFIKDNRQIQFNGYTSATSYSGTAVGYLAFDSSGNIITTAGVAATDNTKLPLAGGTMTGVIAFSNVTGNKIDFYHTTSGSGDRYGVQVQNSELRIHSGAGGDGAGGITFGKSTTTTFTETMRVRNDGIVNIAGYLRTAGATSNTIIWSGGTQSADFGNALGQGTSSRTVFFRGNTSASVWWGGVDGNGANIPFGAIDATAGEFTFWRNSGGTGGGTWTNIMTMNASGLTMVNGSFVGNLSGNATTATTASSVSWNNITSGTRTGHGDLRFQPPANSFAGIQFLDTSGSGAGWFLIRGTSDSDVYTAEGITLVADKGWLTLAQRETANRGVRIMTGATSVTRASFTSGGDITFTGNTTINGVWTTNIATSSGSWTRLSFTATNNWGDGITYGTLGASGGSAEPGVMINNPHIVWNTPATAAVMKFGRSGGVSSGSYYSIGTGASNNFFINKDDAIASPILNINSSGNAFFSGTVTAPTFSGALSGNAASASAVAWSNVSSKPAGWLNTTNLIDGNAPNTAVPSGFWQDIGGAGNPVGTWFNYVNVRHSNPGNVHGYQIGMSYYDNDLWFRSYQGSGTYQSWAKALSSQNFNSYAMSGAGFSANQNLTTGSDVTFSIVRGSSYIVTPLIYSGGGNITMGNNVGNMTIAPSPASWAEGLSFTMPTSSTWGGLRWRRERGNADGNWYIGFTALDSTDDLVFGANNGGSQVDNIIRLSKSGGVSFRSNLTIGTAQGWSSIYMNDSDEGTRELHCNSNRIGFLTQAGAWGSFCDDAGSWSSVGNLSAGSDVYSNGGWFYSYNNAGWYNSTYGQGLRQSKGNVSFGNVITVGENFNGWSGYNTTNTYVTCFMQNSAGTHGFYQEGGGNGWTAFYNFGFQCWGLGTDATDPAYSLHIIKYGGSNTGWIIWSDRRIKENIKTIDNALDKVLALRGVYYNKIDDPNKERCVGYIAQEVMEVVPELVVYSEELDMYNMNYAPMVGMLTEAIKEQQSQIEELKQQVQTLLNS